MKEKNKIFALLFVLLSAFAYKTEAQEARTMANYVFASDSIAGFDEQAAAAGALASNFFGKEYNFFMYKAKRDYLKQKYNLRSEPAPEVKTLFQNYFAAKTAAIGGACNNEDFELAGGNIVAPGAIQGWLAQSGTNFNSSCLPPTINGTANYTVFTSPVVDEKSGVLVSSYFDASTNVVPAGNAFIRLNNSAAGAKASKLTKSFIVGPTNALFQYAYFPVIENGDHLCCDQPGFNIRVTITNTATNASTLLACPQISVAVPGLLCQFSPPPGAPVFQTAPAPNQLWSYHNWAASAIDLTPYLGNQVTIEVVVVDCTATGHGAYAYFDAKCAPMDIIGNGTAFPAGTPSVTLPTCGATSATICAPDGLGPYWWDGPGVVAPYNVPSMSNQCFTTNISSQFTLSMNPPGSCLPITRIITVTITPAPYLLATAHQAACGSTIANVTYTAAGSASVNPVIAWSPVPTTSTSSQNLGSGTFPAGTGVVSITATDPLGCKASASVNINPVAPSVTVSLLNVTGSNSITCFTPTVDLAAVSGYTYGALNFFWSSNSFTANTQTITVTNSSTLITLTATDPNTGCSATATTAIRMNTVAPITSLNPVNQAIGCGAGVVATATSVAISPSINVTHFWYSPTSSNPVSGGGNVSIYPLSVSNPTAATIYTCVVQDNINGCTTTKTAQVISNGGTYPSFSLTSVQNFSIGCTTTSLTNITIAGAQAGGGGVVTYTLLPPNYSGGLAYGTSSVSTYTVNTPGTYTVIVKDPSNNCESFQPVSIIQNTFAPNAAASALTRTLSCDVTSVTLVGSSANSTLGPVNFSWSFANAGNPNVVNNSTIAVTANTAAIAPSNTVINTYTLTVTDQNNACVNTTVVTMWQNVRPPNPVIALSSTSISCVTASVNLTNFSTTGILPNTFFVSQPIVGLLWEGPTPQQPKTNSSTYLGYVPGTYTMVIKDMNNGCTARTTATISDERDYPVLVTTNSVLPLDCGASNTGGVKLPVSLVGMPASAVSPTWYPPVPTPSVQGINTLTLTTNGIGEYKLVVKTNSNQCTAELRFSVVNGALTADFTPDQTSGYAPLTVNFTNISASSLNSNSITTVWSYGNGTTKTTTTNVNTTAVYTAPGTYSVTIFASKGSCLDTMVKTIVVDIPSKLEVPNVFTPNGDGSNDLFFVHAANLTEITAQIFDRWGNKIYELTSQTGNIAWDGKNQSGKEVPDGTYFYTIKATGRDGMSYDTKGTVSLYR